MCCLSNPSLSALAQEAVTQYPNSYIESAMAFFTQVLPEFSRQSNDRLVKAGRSMQNLVDMKDDIPLEESLELLVEECKLLLQLGEFQIPRVRFGKTELQMPIVTLGCMRFQQEWGPRITNMNMVESICQDNLVEILKLAHRHGLIHIETARGYGCSELQLGVAFKQAAIPRQDLIIQTKIAAMPDPGDFRAAIETSFRNLQVDYLDLFTVHGLNYEEQYEWVFGRDGDNCWNVVQEYVNAGKIRHVGFSTHAWVDLITKCINTDVFEYVNLHHHYFGSYTASGGGSDGRGTLDCIRLLKEKDMGVFIISPFDKGGRLYAPSRKLRRLTLPEMEPMAFQSAWIWNHHMLNDEDPLPQLHTYTIGAGRPSDLDQSLVQAYLHSTQNESYLVNLKKVLKRLEDEKVKVLGKEWVETWWKGLPKSYQSKYLVEHNQLVWLYNNMKAFGLYEFAKNRYASFENNASKWDPKLSPEDNIAKNIGKNPWGFVPGLPFDPSNDYADDLARVPNENLNRVREAELFVYKWCRGQQAKKENDEGSKETVAQVPPKEWETAYDMRPWPDFPDQPSAK